MENTNKDYWQCGCDNNYIHPKSETHCEVCDKEEQDCPDANEGEVENYLRKLNVQTNELVVKPVEVVSKIKTAGVLEVIGEDVPEENTGEVHEIETYEKESEDEEEDNGNNKASVLSEADRRLIYQKALDYYKTPMGDIHQSLCLLLPAIWMYFPNIDGMDMDNLPTEFVNSEGDEFIYSDTQDYFPEFEKYYNWRTQKLEQAALYKKDKNKWRIKILTEILK